MIILKIYAGSISFAPAVSHPPALPVNAAPAAVAAQVKRLVLTHLSARYSVATEGLLAEAQEVFPETVVARDGMVVASLIGKGA